MDIDRRGAMVAAAAGVAGIMLGRPQASGWSEAGVPAYAQTGVVLDLPPELRTKNWGGGSCVHASNCTLLKWMGLDDMAAWWRSHYSGGEYDDRLIKRMEAAGLRYAYVKGAENGVQFLEWCTRTRRGAGLFYKPNHSINYVGCDAATVYLLDNNATSYPEQHGTYENVPKTTFYQRWVGYGAFAWTLVYNPAPHTPLAAADTIRSYG